ncbi:hypothetical protein N8H22_15200 [Stutzerimonas stutzeri]|uniref:hypothetical protein n=1 Tax=Stutzerimonas sp. S1 TaxID=3030652 RepID=UPI002225ACE1|nr:hypothetical protein [Stutzerimonas sp. S1]MCW3149950.1 hypothetical protein [Stutzerimonas sp. S1]
MGDPFERATAEAPPVIGSGCTRRYDPDALSDELGTEFAGAAALWAHLQSIASADKVNAFNDYPDSNPQASGAALG